MNAISPLFVLSPLSIAMGTLITVVAVVVASYSARYLAGDRARTLQLYGIPLLAFSALVMVFAGHWVLLLGAWGTSNLLLARLMVHKTQWRQALRSAVLASKTFLFGFLALGTGLALLAYTYKSPWLIDWKPGLAANDPWNQTGLALVLLAVLTQSATWPFHRWLLSSLNSPTPVSALMHAGLVNGGGFLLVRLAPLYLQQPLFLRVLFLVGLATAVVGTFWKLIQTDVKRMLACSTMGQMGFLILQCGMGLFAAAFSHLIWHGLFKAYLFLNSGSVVGEKKKNEPFGRITAANFILSLVMALPPTALFSWATGWPWLPEDTRTLMLVLAFMSATQLGCKVLEKGINGKNILLGLSVSAIAAGSYGLMIRGAETLLEPYGLLQPQKLDALYSGGMLFLAVIWLGMNANLTVRLQSFSFWKTLYVWALNHSRPKAETLTAVRNHYQY